jgi:hypothetical protein
MAFNAHRGTAGHTIGSQIIGKEGSQPPDPAHTSLGFAHMSVKPATNGFAVSHTPHTDKPEDPALEQTHVFRDAVEAHHHIGQLLGVRMASGQQKT